MSLPALSHGYGEKEVLGDIEIAIEKGKGILLLARETGNDYEDARKLRARHTAWVEDAYAFLLKAFRSSDVSDKFGDLTATVDDDWDDDTFRVLTTDIRNRLRTLERLRDSNDDEEPKVKANKPQAARSESSTAYNLLVSWSKPISNALAHAFYVVLPKLLPNAKPWISTIDIDKGTNWFNELQGLLGSAELCVIFVTNENVRTPWLYYESGAIAAKTGDKIRVCPYLVGCTPEIITDGPLGKYQATVATKDDTLRLIRSLNRAFPSPLDENEVTNKFNEHWPEFEKAIVEAVAISKKATGLVESKADELAGGPLSSEARRLLIEAADNESGMIRMTRTRRTLTIAAGRNIYSDGTDKRIEATWIEAISDLRTHQLIESTSYSDEMFRVTAKGYRVAHALKMSGDQSEQD